MNNIEQRKVDRRAHLPMDAKGTPDPQFTPGPWSTKLERQRIDDARVIYSADGHVVATAADHNRFDRDDEADATAKLIVAAPHMYRAIAEFVANGRDFTGSARYERALGHAIEAFQFVNGETVDPPRMNGLASVPSAEFREFKRPRPLADVAEQFLAACPWDWRESSLADELRAAIVQSRKPDAGESR